MASSNGSSFTLSPDVGASVRLYVDGAQVGFGSPNTLVTRYGSPDDARFFVGEYGGGSCGALPVFVSDIGPAGLLADVVRS